jgi:SH3-like domain-containing protein
MQDRRPLVRSKAARRRAWFLLLALGAMVPSVVATAVWGQGSSTVVVTGTKRVLVRRGPGTEFPPFAALTKGSVVEVLEMRGEWSRVKTAGGQVGYVHSNFLALPSEARSAAAGEAPHPQPTATPLPQPTAHSDTAALNTLTERNKALEAQVSALQEELTALKNRPTQTAQPTPTAAAATGDTEDLRTELRRLTVAVEGLQRRMGANPPSNDAAAAGAPPPEATERSVSSTALVLGALGLLLGWVGGITYGRTQERGRRSRIRF